VFFEELAPLSIELVITVLGHGEEVSESSFGVSGDLGDFRIVSASFTIELEGTMATKPIPEGYHTITPYLAVDDAAEAIEYYKEAFGAKERVRMDAPEGKIGHAELEIGDSLVMLSDPFPQAATRSPKELGGSSVSVHMYVEDVDAVVKKAVDAGATITMEVADQFWGDRLGSVKDPFGHLWSIATHVEDVPPEEMAERAKAAMAAMG
jgi:PhnB protein